jgi:hypothetical protein
MLLLVPSFVARALTFVHFAKMLTADSPGAPCKAVGLRMEYEHGTSHMLLVDRPTCHVGSYESDADMHEMQTPVVYHLSSL